MGRIKQIRTSRFAYKLGKAHYTAMCTDHSLNWRYIHATRPVLITLRVPKDAYLRYADKTKRWRVSEAIVESVKIIHDKPMVEPHISSKHTPWALDKVTSSLNPSFEYKAGHTVRPNKPFDMNPDVRSGAGIHCFGNQKDAVAHEWKKE